MNSNGSAVDPLLVFPPESIPSLSTFPYELTNLHRTVPSKPKEQPLTGNPFDTCLPALGSVTTAKTSSKLSKSAQSFKLDEVVEVEFDEEVGAAEGVDVVGATEGESPELTELPPQLADKVNNPIRNR